MANRPNESPSTFLAALPSAVVAWLVMMATGLALGATIEFRLGHLTSLNIAEYVIAFLFAMPVPFALVIAIVYAPLVLSVRVLSAGAKSPLAFGGACLVAAPLAGLLLLAIGSLVWGPPKIGGNYLSFVPTLLTIALGGLVFGLTFGCIDRRSELSN
jgi:hypothetical protein